MLDCFTALCLRPGGWEWQERQLRHDAHVCRYLTHGCQESQQGVCAFYWQFAFSKGAERQIRGGSRSQFYGCDDFASFECERVVCRWLYGRLWIASMDLRSQVFQCR